MATKLKKPIKQKPANKAVFNALVSRASKPLPPKKKTAK